MLESKLMRKIQVALSDAGARVFRNNVGLGWIGKSFHIQEESNIRVFPGDVVIRQARPLHAGLVEGSSDLIGLKSITITQEMVGRRIAVFVAAEIKTDNGVVSTDQRNFLNMVNEAGGIGMVTKTPEDAVFKLKF